MQNWKSFFDMYDHFLTRELKGTFCIESVHISLTLIRILSGGSFFSFQSKTLFQSSWFKGNSYHYDQMI